MSNLHGNTMDLYLRILKPGTLVAVTDGAGMPSSDALRNLSEAAQKIGGVSLLLGWCIGERPGLDFDSFKSIRATFGGYALQEIVDQGRVEYVPTRLGTMPRLLSGTLRPDVVLTSMVPRGDALAFGTEIGWALSAMRSANFVLVEENHAKPTASAVADIPRGHVHVVGESYESPDVLLRPNLDEAALRIGQLVASLIQEGDTVQVGPGVVGETVLGALTVPVHIDSGIIVDAVVDLDQRGLLLGNPMATYIAGSPRLYKWANLRPILRGVEETLNLERLSAQRLFAVNTALEIDESGQVNVEMIARRTIAGIGGHADFAFSASRSDGLSIIALPTVRGGHRTLVERLTSPTSTARTDVDVVVTEFGVADLRGLSDKRRCEALLAIW